MKAAEVLADTPTITYRQLDFWCSKGWLRPDQRGGSGYARTFSGDEARVARTMARLVAAGLKPDAAHRVARGEQELAPGIVVLVDPPAPELELDAEPQATLVGELVAA